MFVPFPYLVDAATGAWHHIVDRASPHSPGGSKAPTATPAAPPVGVAVNLPPIAHILESGDNEWVYRSCSGERCPNPASHHAALDEQLPDNNTGFGAYLRHFRRGKHETHTRTDPNPTSRQHSPIGLDRPL